jgi:hypothetical protein
MTLFEYLSIAYTLVLSFAAVRLVDGLSNALAADRRYWVHAAYVGLMLLATLVVFWTHWSAHEVDWTFLTFAISLSGPGIVYFLACTIMPDEPGAVTSWRDYFFSVRGRFFGGLCAWAVLMFMQTTVVTGVPLLHASRIIPVGLLIFGLSGLATVSPRAHARIVLVAVLVSLVAAVIVFRPSALAA